MKPDGENGNPQAKIRPQVQVLGGVSVVVILGLLEIFTDIEGLQIVGMGLIGLVSAVIYDFLRELPEWREEQHTVWLRLRTRLIFLTLVLIGVVIVALINYNRWSSPLITFTFWVTSALVSAVLIYLVSKPLELLRNSRATLEAPQLLPAPPKKKAKKNHSRRRR